MVARTGLAGEVLVASVVTPVTATQAETAGHVLFEIELPPQNVLVLGVSASYSQALDSNGTPAILIDVGVNGSNLNQPENEGRLYAEDDETAQTGAEFFSSCHPGGFLSLGITHRGLISELTPGEGVSLQGTVATAAATGQAGEITATVVYATVPVTTVTE